MSKIATREPSEMILGLSDLPQDKGWVVGEKAERVRSDISEEGQKLGWQKGYYVRYNKIGENIFEVTTLEHVISIYPSENISKLLSSLPRISDKNYTFDELSDPKIGNTSKAYRITEEQEFISKTGYLIEFVKYDVYSMLTISGTVGIDYEFLKELSRKAESKIQ